MSDPIEIDIDLSQLPPETLAIEILALLEAVDFEYEAFADALELDEKLPETDLLHRQALAGYADTWTAMGTDEFVEALAPKVMEWKIRLAVAA